VWLIRTGNRRSGGSAPLLHLFNVSEQSTHQ
jgi:hypothetical protein